MEENHISSLKKAAVPFAMGFMSLLFQVTAIRELLTIFSGNELVIGITVSFWLMFVGAGSYVGTKIKFKASLGLSFIAVAALSVPTVFLIKSLRLILSLSPGETASLVQTLLWTGLSLMPLCLLLGAQFPLAVGQRGAASEEKGEGEGDNPAGTVYGLEAFGAFVGGLAFTFLLSGRAGSLLIAAGLGAASALIASWVLQKKAATVVFALPLLIYFLTVGVDTSGYPGVRNRVQSRYGEIWISQTGPQANVYSSGHLLFSHPDAQAAEFSAHMAMVVHPDPRDVLLVGGSAGAIGEFLKHPVTRLDFVEMDPALVRVSLGLLEQDEQAAVNDKRVSIINEDARKFIKGLKGPAYDLITLELMEPATANANRFYTVDFFREARAGLKPGGVLAIKLPTSFGYVSKRMQRANGSVYNSLVAVFPHVVASTEEYGRFFASEAMIDTSPEVLEARLEQRGIVFTHFHPSIYTDAFSPLRAALYQGRLARVKELNTDLRPSAYLYNLMLWAEMQKQGGGAVLGRALSLGGQGWVGLVLVLSIAAAAACRRQTGRTLGYSIFTTGYLGMALSVVIVLGFQAAHGYVYESIGLLTALFMIGAGAGAAAGAWGLGKYKPNSSRPLRVLLALEAAGVGFSLLIFFFAAQAFTWAAGAYVLMFISGVIAGAGFSAVTQCTVVNRGAATTRSEQANAGGRLYSLELAGSFVGAMVTVILLVPLLGMQGAVLSAAGVKILSPVLLVLIIRKPAQTTL